MLATGGARGGVLTVGEEFRLGPAEHCISWEVQRRGMVWEPVCLRERQKKGMVGDREKRGR